MLAYDDLQHGCCVDGGCGSEMMNLCDGDSDGSNGDEIVMWYSGNGRGGGNGWMMFGAVMMSLLELARPLPCSNIMIARGCHHVGPRRRNHRQRKKNKDELL